MESVGGVQSVGLKKPCRIADLWVALDFGSTSDLKFNRGKTRNIRKAVAVRDGGMESYYLLLGLFPSRHG